MRHRLYLACVISLIALTVLSGCSTASPAAQSSQEAATAAPSSEDQGLTVLFTNDGRGKVDPCG